MKKFDTTDLLTLLVVVLLLIDNDFSEMTIIKWLGIIATSFLFIALVIKYYVKFFMEK